MTPEQREESARATERAKVFLKPGDRISAKRCGGGKSHFTMTGWDGVWICGKTISDVHASSVYRVNGIPLEFYHRSENA